MASSFIPTHTPIPNVYLDVLMSRMSASEFKVLMYLSREMFGLGNYDKGFTEGEIATATGFEYEFACIICEKLLDKKLVKDLRNHLTGVSYYLLNLDYEATK